MKKYLFIATALAALASCSDNEFVGDVGPTSPTGLEKGVISFTSNSKAVTRAIEGETAANLLNKNFVLVGTKGETPQTVFNNYQANYVNNTAHSTESNTHNWEYVGYKNLPNGVGTNVGVTNYATADANSAAIDQTIKYWDYGTTQYDFAAYSLGTGAGTTPTYATASAINFENLGTTNGVFTLTGSADELKACYISDLVTYYNKQAVEADDSDPENPIAASPAANEYGKPVQFSFRSLGAKIRLAFYETVPGYSVKEVQFYTSSDATLATDGTQNDPTLYVKTNDTFKGLPKGEGTMTITYPTIGWNNKSNTDYNKAHISFAPKAATDLSSTLVLEDLTSFAAPEKSEATGDYLGRTSNTATYAGGLLGGSGKYYTILPYEAGANLQLRIKYTLVATDGYGETITVDNATAVIPAELAQWQPNYAYTYIFKISDMTNGSTGTDGNGNIVTGLTPITLNAVVVESETGVQETITTVSEPSITTYTKGKVVTENDEYVTGNTIYVIVNNGTSNEELTVGTNAKLYTVTIEDGAAQTISEESIDNALAYGTYNDTDKTYTVTDAKNKKLVVTDTESTLLSASTKIEASDSPTGNEITVDGAKFEAGDAGTIYVFQYIKTARTYYTQSQANTYNAALTGAISASNEDVFSFESYASDKTTKYGDGKVKVVSVANGWTTVLVTSNTSTDANAANFVGLQFKVEATTLDATKYYQLYTADGTATSIYVKVATNTLSEEEANRYNATLAGAVSTSTVKDPGKYGYKIIKIKQ